MSLQDRLKKHCKEHEINAENLAHRTGVSRSQAYWLLHGTWKRGPCLDTVEQIARGLGLTPAMLAFGPTQESP